jgi:hypothetical protein
MQSLIAHRLCQEAGTFFAQYPDSNTNISVYLDRTGEVTSERCEAEDWMPGYGKPAFEVCHFSAAWPNGVIHGDAATEAGIDKALEDAEAERLRFYQERTEIFGAEAWPKTA